ncbi:MAG: hypothetical protein II453_06070 [Alphaproteobacteria bacterium]|jgi:hypothetical protein|nr:hypothetical protein [Alphaproteobacteria bacterium]
MGFTNGAYAKIWSKEEHEKYTTCQVSVSKKNQETGEYEVEFQDGYVMFLGNAHEAISEIDDIPENGLSVRLVYTDTRNKYVKEKKKMYTNFYVFKFELPGNESDDSSDNSKKSAKSSAKKTTAKKTATKTVKKKVETPIEDEDEDLPF